MHINPLGQILEFKERGRFTNPHDLILNPIRKVIVENVVECTFSISTNLGSKVIELYYILVDMIAILHGEVVQLMFDFCNWIMRAKIECQLHNEFKVVVCP